MLTKKVMGVADGKTGAIFIKPTYWRVDKFGAVYVASDLSTDDFGFYNRKGELFVPMAKYERIYQLPDGRVHFKLGTKVFYIDREGNPLDGLASP